MEEVVLHKTLSHPNKLFTFYTKVKKYLSIIGFESIVWISGLVYLAFFSPITQSHFTICPLANMGVDFCPGCGLGHSITLIFHGYFAESFNTHPLGFFAAAIIFYRIFTLIKTNLIKSKKAEA